MEAAELRHVGNWTASDLPWRDFGSVITACSVQSLTSIISNSDYFSLKGLVYGGKYVSGKKCVS